MRIENKKQEVMSLSTCVVISVAINVIQTTNDDSSIHLCPASRESLLYFQEVIQTVNVVNALVAAAAINSVLAVPWTRVDEVYVTIVLLGTLVINVKNVQMDIMVIL